MLGELLSKGRPYVSSNARDKIGTNPEERPKVLRHSVLQMTRLIHMLDTPGDTPVRTAQDGFPDVPHTAVSVGGIRFSSNGDPSDEGIPTARAVTDTTPPGTRRSRASARLGPFTIEEAGNTPSGVAVARLQPDEPIIADLHKLVPKQVDGSGLFVPDRPLPRVASSRIPIPPLGTKEGLEIEASVNRQAAGYTNPETRGARQPLAEIAARYEPPDQYAALIAHNIAAQEERRRQEVAVGKYEDTIQGVIAKTEGDARAIEGILLGHYSPNSLLNTDGTSNASPSQESTDVPQGDNLLGTEARLTEATILVNGNRYISPAIVDPESRRLDLRYDEVLARGEIVSKEIYTELDDRHTPPGEAPENSGLLLVSFDYEVSPLLKP